MALLQLPNELLGTILDLSRPYDFEDLALTCKHTYSVARPFLVRHNELRRKYRHFRFARIGEDRTRSTDGLTWFVPQLLLDIAQDPIVPSYIIHADLSERNHTENYLRQRFENIRITLEQLDARETRDKLRELLRGSWFLGMIDANPDQWLERILADDDQWDEPCEFGLVFLMSLLVNVESLILPGSWSSANAEPRENREGGIEPYQYEVSQLMQSLVKLANDGTTRQWPLKKLRKLLPSHQVDTQMGMEMISIAPFLALQSMRRVRHASGKYICYAGSPPWDTMYPAIGPNIESLELLDYVIDEEASATFFKDMKKLKTFKMEYSMKDEIGDGWKANQFVQNMMSAVGTQLEVLSLTIGWMYANEDPVTDLSGFTALQKLELDVELFECWMDIQGSEEPDVDDPEPSILEMLPDSLPSLKELRLECLPIKSDVQRLEILLRDFGSSKGMQLPNLVSAKVYIDTAGGSSLRSMADKEQNVQRAQKNCAGVGNIEFTTSETLNPEEGDLQGDFVHTRHGTATF